MTNQAFSVDGALWTNKDRTSENQPTHRGSVTIGGKKRKIVAWLDENPEGNRPTIKFKLDSRQYQMARELLEEMGDNLIDHPTNQPRGEHGKLDEVHGNAANIEYSITEDKDEGES